MENHDFLHSLLFALDTTFVLPVKHMCHGKVVYSRIQKLGGQGDQNFHDFCTGASRAEVIPLVPGSAIELFQTTSTPQNPHV